MLYYRYTHEGNMINQLVGFGMFAKNEGRVVDCYGPIRYTYGGTDGIDIHEMRERFMQAWEECKDCAPDYMQDLTAEEFFKLFNPDDIVDDAQAWDNPDFRRFFSKFVYNDESAILLDDGAIVFDENLIVEG